MKNLNNKGFLFACTAMFLMASCAKAPISDFEVSLPEGYNDEYDYLADYGTLKSYAGADFKIGTEVSFATYADQMSPSNVLINSNLSEVTPLNLNHASIVDEEGQVVLNPLKAFIASANNISVYGTSLLGYENQNDLYLESVVASYYKDVDPANPTKDIESAEMIDDGELSESSSFSVDGSATFQACDTQGLGGLFEYSASAGNPGGCISLNNEGAGQARVIVKFNVDPIRSMANASNNDKYIYSFDIKTSKKINMGRIAMLTSDASPIMKIMTIKEGKVINAGEWTKVVAEFSISADDDFDFGSGFDQVLLNLLGSSNATQMWFDNFSFKCVSTVPNGTLITYTPAEKKAKITEQMTNYITGVVSSSPSIKSWSIVNSPLTDNIWKKYMGNDYLAEAIKLVRANNSEAMIFVDESGLEDAAQCDKFVSAISGLDIEGISVNVNPECDDSKEIREANIVKFTEMLKTLSATGKMIRLTGLDVKFTVGGVEYAPMNKTEHNMISAFYGSVIKAYLDAVPAEQQYGISKTTLIDKDGTELDAAVYYGLWNVADNGEIKRKHEYKGFAEGLQ